MSFKSDLSKDIAKGKRSPLRQISTNIKMEEEKKKRTRIITRTQSTKSSVFFKSDQSKDVTKGKRSPSRVPLKHKASTGSNCSSIKTDQSQDFIDANKRCLSSSSEDAVAADDADSDLTRSNSIAPRRSLSKEGIIDFKATDSPFRPDCQGVSFPMECYRSPLRHELSANVRSPLFPLKHTASTGSICLSSEKDRCKERLPLNHRASTGSICVSDRS